MKLRGTAVPGILISAAIIFSALPALAVPDEIKLTVHYNRSAGDYSGWNLWIWKNSERDSQDVPVSTTGVQFTADDDFGKVAKVTLTGMNTFKDVGIIVRLNDWSAKDISDDRFISRFDTDGNAEIWLIQNDKSIYYEKPDIRLKISSAYFEDLKKVKIELSKKYLASAVASGGFVIDNGVKVTKVTGLNGDSTGSTLFALDLSDEIDLTKQYRISHAAMESREISLGNAMGSEAFAKEFTYVGEDLGNTYSKNKTAFRLWAPTASKVELLTYQNADATTATKTVMSRDANGTWVTSLTGDRDGLIYTYAVEVNGVVNEVVDPYVRAATLNGRRGVVVDLKSTDPSGWTKKKPLFTGKPTDAVFYELHIRDLSMDQSAPFPNLARGKFAALTFSNLKGKSGQPVGVAAIKDLGITHLQILPMYDYASVDEANPTFNWGYDPLNYNVPEGSYSSNPSDPKARIIELKQAIQALHDQGIRVVMDVVYNHVYDANSFSQSKIVPGYWFRTTSSGALTSASGCGNDTASERSMVSKFIVDSVKYWASEYNLSGFRFDLMGLHDLDTMTKVRNELNKIDPSIVIIGEGWNMGTHPEEIRSTQRNIKKLPGIAVFNDQIRDGVKGSVFDSTNKGFATGDYIKNLSVRAGIVGNIQFSNELSPAFTTLSPAQSVNYVEAHDNNTLEDKIRLSVADINDDEVARLHRLASSIPILAQGIPFIHAGQEFQRSKNGDSNSYKSSDKINALNWDLVTTNAVSRSYFKGLIEIRKNHPVFRLSTSAQVKASLNFLKTPNAVIAYELNGEKVKDKWKQVVVIHNAGQAPFKMNLPRKGDWRVVVEGERASQKELRVLKSATSIEVAGQTTSVLYLGNRS
jgi:pullulanase